MFFSYAFHHQGIAVAKFKKDNFAPLIVKTTSSYDNTDHHLDVAFHPFIKNQWVEKTYCETEGTAFPPVLWESNRFKLTIDDIGILCPKRRLYIEIHFYSK